MTEANVQTTIPISSLKVNKEPESQDSLNTNVSVEVPATENICSTQDQIKSDKLTTEVWNSV